MAEQHRTDGQVAFLSAADQRRPPATVAQPRAVLPPLACKQRVHHPFLPDRGSQMEGRTPRLIACARPGAGAEELLNRLQRPAAHGMVQARPPVVVRNPEQGPDVFGRGRCNESGGSLALSVHARQH